ncbi:MAG: hypothetical protein RsTaC01_0858 [Candidatus Paraimprobicoccus trichonymphae]|uniref:Six-cysteine peptide SCIFF n=1 Tax=Candidatus Paraimprobicoccus trichonymphae TaxID=3033793 RepID=A0AA48IHJ0_9FIRM|nr:MAG: hypothetical protein RsTaC01_0858 [Candidatus Paraimprobicoccus trichonymphae]
MSRVKTLYTGDLNFKNKDSGCCKCGASCQTVGKTDETTGNQSCERTKQAKSNLI